MGTQKKEESYISTYISLYWHYCISHNPRNEIQRHRDFRNQIVTRALIEFTVSIGNYTYIQSIKIFLQRPILIPNANHDISKPYKFQEKNCKAKSLFILFYLHFCNYYHKLLHLIHTFSTASHCCCCICLILV